MPQRNRKKQTGKAKNKNKKKKQDNNKNNKKKQQVNKEPNAASETANDNATESKQNDTISTNASPQIESKKEDNPKDASTEEPSVKDLLSKRPNADKRDPNRAHKFWNKQPVPQMNEKFEQAINGPIEIKTQADVRQQPLLLPKQFEWVELDLNEEKTVDELYHLLANHYVEDDDNRFRFNYSKAFLKWALMVPGYLKTWHLGVRVVKSGALCGCITAIPAQTSIYKKDVPMVEINFLCVHKKLRSNRLAPVLISEITRRVNCAGRWQAVYTAGVVLPKPIAANRYWHRSLNPEKLVDVGFSSMNRRMTKPRLRKLFKLPAETLCVGLRVLKEKDCAQAHELLNGYLKKFSLHVSFNLDEFKHCFLSREGVVYSFVIVNAASKQVTDFISFYELPSTIMNNPKYNGMKAAYSYYNVVTSVKWVDIMYDALILAKQRNFDVFNALDVMDNSIFLKELKFKIGDGHLQYYLFNWKCAELKPSQVALVLL